MNIQKAMGAKAIFALFYQVKMSPKLSYKLLRLCKPIEEAEQFYQSERNKIIDEYALKDTLGRPQVDEKGFVLFDDAYTSEVQEAIAQLNSIDIEVPPIKLTVDELSVLQLSVIDLAAIEAFIDED